jgi:hypothetical protein
MDTNTNTNSNSNSGIVFVGLILLICGLAIGYSIVNIHVKERVKERAALKFQTEKYDTLRERFKVEHPEFGINDRWMDPEDVARMWNDSIIKCKDSKSEDCTRLKAALLDLEIAIKKNDHSAD